MMVIFQQHLFVKNRVRKGFSERECCVFSGMPTP